MIDYLKLRTRDVKTIHFLWNHPLLFFYSTKEFLLFDRETINLKQTKQYREILFELTKDALYIRFKPHYFFNDNLHNANDFNVSNSIQVLNDFAKLFNLKLKHLEIINMEFGLNVIIPEKLICVKDLLAYMIYHKQNEFRADRKYSYCIYSHSTNKKGIANVYKMIKAYAKGIQFPTYTDKNTFRFEIKSNRKRYINSLGIYTLDDLLKSQLYKFLCEMLLKEFDEILIIDIEAIPQISQNKLNRHYKRLNPFHWRKLFYRSRNVFKRHFNTYHRDLNTCETHLKKEIRKLISTKLDELNKDADSNYIYTQNCTLFNSEQITV